MFGTNINVNPFKLSRRWGRPLILDGAMGSMLQQSGMKSSGPLWMSKINIDNPDVVFKIHRQYIEAGADIITTNTFRSNPVAVNNYRKRINFKKFVKAGIQIAKDAASDSPVFIAGSNPPAEDCYQRPRNITSKALKENHYSHIECLMDNGAHFILNETQSHLDEIKIISNFCCRNEIPYVISIFIDHKLNLLSGEKISEAIKTISDYNPLAIGINCVMPGTFFDFFDNSKMEFNWGTYLNCGDGKFEDENIQCGIFPPEYGKIVKIILKKKPSFIGSCCGSTPEHTKTIKKILDEKIRT